MYAFAQRKDTTVVDEPLYAHYLSKTSSGAIHPMTKEILDQMENNGQKVVDNVIFISKFQCSFCQIFVA